MQLSTRRTNASGERRPHLGTEDSVTRYGCPLSLAGLALQLSLGSTADLNLVGLLVFQLGTAERVPRIGQVGSGRVPNEQGNPVLSVDSQNVPGTSVQGFQNERWRQTFGAPTFGVSEKAFQIVSFLHERAESDSGYRLMSGWQFPMGSPFHFW